MDVRVFEVAAEALGESLRTLADRTGRFAQHAVDGDLVVLTARDHREHLFEGGDLQLVHADRASDRMLAEPGDQVAATEHQPCLRSSRGACLRST